MDWSWFLLVATTSVWLSDLTWRFWLCRKVYYRYIKFAMFHVKMQKS
jgi:hypothetical protein